MKKIYIAIALFIGISSLFAKDMKMIIHQQDGTTKEYLTEDVGTMSFIKSNVPPILKIYHQIEALNAQYDTKDIDSLSFSNDNEELWISYDGGKIKYLLDELDSLVFKPVERDEIKICDQVWMTKNLDVDHYRNGDLIPQVSDSTEWANLTTGAWCYYENDPANGEIYGKLYNWYAVIDPRGLAPGGWHLPTDKEWIELENCLGLSEEPSKFWQYRGTNEGSKLSGEYDLWKQGLLRSDSNFGTTEFSGLPGGYRRNNATFTSIGRYGTWWTLTEFSTERAIARHLYFLYSNIIRYQYFKRDGFAVRCVKGDLPEKTIELSTKNIGETFEFNDEIEIEWTTNGVENVKIEFSKDDGVSWTQIGAAMAIDHYFVFNAPQTSSAKCKIRISDMVDNEIYDESENFTIIISKDNEIQICDKIWNKRNLDVDHYRNGDPIPQVTDSTEWANLTTGAWCYYNNDPTNGEVYGKLYNWYAVNDLRGLAPEGWHIPTDEEWKEIEMCLGIGEDEIDYRQWRGTNEGSKLAGEYDLWREKLLRNNSAFGSSGFNGLPGGYCNYNLKYYDGLRYNGYWWTSTEFSSETAIARQLYYQFTNILKYDFTKKTGLSVRCVRD
jgi:uncharacterized protein (TIGR02145 family)